MPRIHLPKRFRYGLRGATTGGGAGGFTTLGPNAPAIGLTSPFPDFLGDTLPNRTSPSTLNAYGMGGLPSQTHDLEIVADAESPSGFALRTWMRGRSSPRVGVSWPSPSYGGAGPSGRTNARGLLYVAGSRQWTKLYINHWARVSAGFSYQGDTMSETILFTGTGTSGSTTLKLVDSTQAWTPGALVGAFVRIGTEFGSVITANDATSVTWDAVDSVSTAPTGLTYKIFTLAPTGVLGYNSTYKGFFWPRFTCRIIGDQTKRGGGAILGTNWSKDVSGSPATENGYMGTYVYDGTSSPGKLWCGYGQQTTKTWLSPWTEDGNGLPVWGGSRFGTFPLNTAPAALTYATGDLIKAEYFLQMNTPGVANGIYRVWLGGAPLGSPTIDFTNVTYCEQYISALSVENGGGTVQPTLAGSKRDVAYEIIEAYWNYLWSDWIFGGGSKVPLNDQYVQTLALAVSGL